MIVNFRDEQQDRIGADVDGSDFQAETSMVGKGDGNREPGAEVSESGFASRASLRHSARR